jgi:hypothetical protein
VKKMNDQTGNEASRYALLIGIDCYLPNELSGGGDYPSLSGCVRDIAHVEEFLKCKLGIKGECILKLTATSTDGTEPMEPREEWPTYENIVAAFQKIIDRAKAGDQVYVHYSGHGGRTKTAYPEIKGPKGVDEALVPVDVGKPGGRYLRDIEVAHLLKTMVDKGLIVAVVLDCCHSGGATRGIGGATVRGISTIDSALRTPDSLVASGNELKSTWNDLSGGMTRNIKTGSGWLTEPKGYVLLAACRASESAHEFSFDGNETSGALTYWLLDSLKQIGPGLTYKQVHDIIIAKIHSQFEDQTPQLEGEGNHIVFGSDQVIPLYSVNVLKIDEPGQRLLLNAGQAQSLRKGVVFAIYPQSASDFTRIDQRLALAEVVALGATESWAKITKRLLPDAIEQGFQAVILDTGTTRLRRVVCLVDQDGSPAAAEALKKVENALVESASGFIKLAEKNEPADLQVAVSGAVYEIWDSSGKPIRNLSPALGIDDDRSALRIAQRLIHLAKYRNVQELDNRDAMSPLARKLVVELLGKQADFDPVDAPMPQPFKDPGNTPSIDIGEWTFLRVKNESDRILNVTILDMQPDWGISQIYPSGSAYFEPLDPGQEITMPLRVDLPPQYVEGTDLIKVFGTLGSADFRWLELPPLDQPLQKTRAVRAAPSNPLEELLAQVTKDGPKTRNLAPAALPSWEWAAAQLEIRIKRS